jgi:hypothetical protein
MTFELIFNFFKCCQLKRINHGLLVFFSIARYIVKFTPIELYSYLFINSSQVVDIVKNIIIIITDTQS